MKIGVVQNNSLGYSQVRFGLFVNPSNSRKEAAEKAVKAARERWEGTCKALEDYRRTNGGTPYELNNSKEYGRLDIENSEAYRAYSNLVQGCQREGLIETPHCGGD